MTHFASYIKERQGKEIIEDEFGFATFYFFDGNCYIEDIFVLKEHRKAGHASRYADQIATIAKQKECAMLLGSVKPTANGSTESLKVLLAYGFKLHSAVNDFIWFNKSLED